MGGSNSVEADDCSGYRVLGVQDKSPASQAGLVSFFDFIIAANGVNFDQHDDTFVEILKQNIGKPVCLTVYNFKCGSTRGVVLTPSSDWHGQNDCHGSVLLGVTISWDSYFQADEHVLRILEIEAGSPAQEAGLMPGEDFLLGTMKVDFKDLDFLNRELHEHLSTPLEVYVYNSSSDYVRRVKIIPRHQWGGNGCFGASVGSGYLHSLPEYCRGTVGNCKDSDLPTIPIHSYAEKMNGEKSPRRSFSAEERFCSTSGEANYESTLDKMKKHYQQVKSEVVEVDTKNYQLKAQISSVEEELDEAIYHLELLNELAAKIPALQAEVSTYRNKSKARIK